MNTVPVDNRLLSVSEGQIRPLYIEGYTHQLSYQPGDPIEFHISTSASQYSLEIVRVGADYEVVWQEKNLSGNAYPIPEDASSNGCHWPVGFTLTIPGTWQSGYYVAKMRVADSGGRFIHQSDRTAEGFLFFIFIQNHLFAKWIDINQLDDPEPVIDWSFNR